MKLLPYESFEIESPKSSHELVSLLASHVEERRWFRWPWEDEHAAFEGTVSLDGFEISRIIHHRKSFLPFIRGTFRSSRDGTKIVVRMCLHPFVMLFVCVWLGLGALGNMHGVPVRPTREGHAPGVPIGTVAMGLVVWAVSTGSFWVQARRERAKLIKIFSTNEKGIPKHVPSYFENGPVPAPCSAQLQSLTGPQCVSCANPVPVGARYCPKCGWIQPI